MLLKETLNQPIIALHFLIGGLLGYVIYEAFFCVKTLLSAKIIEVITDCLAVVSNVLLFIVIAKAVNYGQLPFYQFLCYFAGFLISRLILVKTIRKVFVRFSKKIQKKFANFLLNVHNKLKAYQTNVKRRKYERTKIRELQRQQHLRSVRVQRDELSRQGVEERKATRIARMRTRNVLCNGKGTTRNLPQCPTRQVKCRNIETPIKRQAFSQPFAKTIQRVFGNSERS